MSKAKKTWILFAVLFSFPVIYAGVRFGPDLMTAQRQGFFEGEKKVAYDGTAIENLKALHTALMLYHDSEGQLPIAAGWMDAIENRLNTADLKAGEANKKLRDPRLTGDAYGFAMNGALSGKFKDDVEGGPNTVLLFDSSDTSRNAHGDPDKLAPQPSREGGRLAITLGGAILIDGSRPNQAEVKTQQSRP